MRHLRSTVLFLTAAIPWLLILTVAIPGGAMAHFAPSPDVNNRYLKVILLPDGVRLTYTLYFGERPGAQERVRMDQNGDGLLDDGERASFGQEVLAAVAPRILLEVDGAGAPAWSVADVGVGVPTQRGGSFAVDLVVRVPLAAGPAHRAHPAYPAHKVELEDRFPVPSPGETEVVVEEAPGVRLTASHLADEPQTVRRKLAFRGLAERANERRVVIQFVVEHGTAEKPAQQRRLALWAVIAPALLLAGAAFWVVRRRQR